MFFQLDVWLGVTGVSFPVDIRVPPHTLQALKSFLEGHDMEYSTMIEDLQVYHESTCKLFFK